MILGVVLIVVALLLAISVVRGAPYVPTHKKSIELGLDLMDLKPGQHLIDVGSGDGSVLIAAAKRGIRATGYEINPLLYFVSRWRTRKYKKLVSIKLGDMWQMKFPDDLDGVFVFTMGWYMSKLAKKITDQGLEVRLISHAFELPGYKISKKSAAMFRYDIKK